MVQRSSIGQISFRKWNKIRRSICKRVCNYYVFLAFFLSIKLFDLDSIRPRPMVWVLGEFALNGTHSKRGIYVSICRVACVPGIWQSICICIGIVYLMALHIKINPLSGLFKLHSCHSISSRVCKWLCAIHAFKWRAQWLAYWFVSCVIGVMHAHKRESGHNCVYGYRCTMYSFRLFVDCL